MYLFICLFMLLNCLFVYLFITSIRHPIVEHQTRFNGNGQYTGPYRSILAHMRPRVEQTSGKHKWNMIRIFAGVMSGGPADKVVSPGPMDKL